MANEKINEKLTKVPYQLNGSKLDTTNARNIGRHLTLL
jgi:hypothetical protein